MDVKAAADWLILHVLLALAVVHQLAISLFFDSRQYSFRIALRCTHDRVGLATGVLLGLSWVWTINRCDRPGFFDFSPGSSRDD